MSEKSQKNPLQHAEAIGFQQRILRALEHELPRGTLFLCMVQGPGFNTVATNLGRKEQLELLREYQQQVTQEVLRQGPVG